MRILVAAALVAAAAPLAPPVFAPPALANGDTVRVRLSFARLPVGRMAYTVRRDGARYTIDGTVDVGGVARVASSASGAFRSRGTLGADGPVPARHELSYRDGRKEGATSIRFAAGQAPKATETPPPKPRRDRVPVTDAALRGAIDPGSALLVVAPKDAGAKGVCDRTRKVFDGRNVFRLTMSGTAAGRLKDGTPTRTCRVRYEPIAGHRTSRDAVKRLRRAKMELTFAALGGEPHVWGLIAFEVPTRYGTARGRARGVDPA